MTIQRLLSKLSNRWHRGNAARKQTEKARRRRLLVEHLEDRKLLAAIHPLPLSSLSGTNGFRIDGVDAGDNSSWSVSNAGDVNGDGFDDLILGARLGDAGAYNSGESYVVFGKSGGFTSALALSSLDGTNGFRLDGANSNDRSGHSVSAAGDVNGDGFDDLIVGASYGGPGWPGESHVIFGKSTGFASAIALAGLDGNTGFRIQGATNGDRSGYSVSGAGDVNGDGFDDLIVGGLYASPSGTIGAGSSYVIFGKSGGFSPTLSLFNLNGNDGFRLDGVDQLDRSGRKVSSAGDVNGDGLDDLLVAAREGDTGGYNSGESYVVFGKTGGFPSTIALSSLDGTNGFRLDGIDPGDGAGVSLSSAGDVNGDGFDDLIVGASGANSSGESYVVFGKSGGFDSTIALSGLNGTSGFRIDGTATNDASGYSVSGAGDVNGDGFDDLMIGAFGVGATQFRAGAAYLLFGKSGGFASAIALASLNGNNGFRMDGVNTFDGAGRSLSGAGDVNGDGFDDLIVGTPTADPNGSDSGSSYVIFGGNFTGGAETQVGGSANDTLTANQGPAAVDILIGGLGNDMLASDGGSDVLIGGPGDDILAITDTNFTGTRRLVGGNGFDTLRLDGSNLTLDLTAIADNRIVDIEQIDITGTGNNTLTLTASEVLNLSTHSNTVIVRRDTGDVVNIGPGWTQQDNEVIGPDTFEVFTQGAATLKVQQVSVPASVVASHVYHFGSSFDQPGNLANALDTGKQLAKEGPSSQLLNYNNLINGSRGINGLVFDIANLAGTPNASDFTFQMSPTGAFDAGANPVGSWASAPAPSSVSVITGSQSRVVITWPNNAIANRWLRITVNATANTGLAAPEVYYLGHLLGETTGPSGSVFTVSFADVTPIRTAVGSSVNASSIVDIDKNGTVAFADISAMRPNVGAQLTIITIPASGGGGGGSGEMVATPPGGEGLGGAWVSEKGGVDLRLLSGGLLDQQYQPKALQGATFKAKSLQASTAARDWLFAGMGSRSASKQQAEMQLEFPSTDVNLTLETIIETLSQAPQT